MGHRGLVSIIEKEKKREQSSLKRTLSTCINIERFCARRIADKLVDELMMEIAKELQMDDVIQKLFELEFQEF